MNMLIQRKGAKTQRRKGDYPCVILAPLRLRAFAFKNGGGGLVNAWEIE
jgi:hypothetical protein